MPVAELSEQEIQELVTIPKPLPADYRNHLRSRTKPYSAQHEEAQIEVQLPKSGTFRLMVRKNRINPLDFSVILGYVPINRRKLFRIRRYNGLHEHSNKLENTRFRGFHIHYATQRYQEAGWDIDKFATPTDRYETLDGAIEACLDDCFFIRPEQEKSQPKLL